MRLAGSVGLGMLLLAVTTPAQDCTVTDCRSATHVCLCAVGSDLPTSTNPGPVTIRPDGTLAREVATPGRRLNTFDELEGSEQGSSVSLTCPNSNTNVVLSGAFLAVVNPPSSLNCVIRLEVGDIRVVTDGKSGVETGLTAASSEGTIYEMRVRRRGSVVVREAAVFDGSVIVRTAGSRDQVRVEAGTRRGVGVGRAQAVPLAENEYAAAAQVLAEMSLARARAQGKDYGSRTEVAVLQRDYVNTLKQPADVDARLRLAARLIDFETGPQALYYVDSVDRTHGISNAQRAETTLFRGMIYKQTGNDARGQQEIERARRINPRVEQEIQKYQIQPRILNQIRLQRRPQPE